MGKWMTYPDEIRYFPNSDIYRVVYFDKYCRGVLEDRPLKPGHIMIIPRYDDYFEPKKSFTEFVTCELEHLAKGITECTRIVKKYNPDVKDVYVIRLVSKQWVHFHLIPQTNREDFKKFRTNFSKCTDTKDNGYWYLAALEKEANEKKKKYDYKIHKDKTLWEGYLEKIIKESKLGHIIEKCKKEEFELRYSSSSVE